MTISKVGALAVGVLAVGAAVALPATAGAEPPPPPQPVVAEEPAPPPPPPPPPGPTVPIVGAPLGPNGLGVLAQTGQDSVPGALGAPTGLVGLDRTTVLGQNPVPEAPGGDPGIVPNLNVFNNAYGLAQNEVPAAPGQGQQFDVGPGEENADVSRREWFGRYIDLYRDGRLKGGLLGQMPQEQLGEPLPGTAPPPGTNVPPGLVQFLPDPVDPAAPPPPPPPAP
jgi:hypothetical protein